jgi:hypothetical protein
MEAQAMTIYSRVFTVPPAQEKWFELEIEGDIIDMVRIRFPPGPAGLLKIAVFYGNEQIFPAEQWTFFAGDNEVIQWDEYWPLPERKTTIRVWAKNEDDTYEHSFYLVINTKYKHEISEERLAKAIARLIRPLTGITRVFSRMR